MHACICHSFETRWQVLSAGFLLQLLQRTCKTGSLQIGAQRPELGKQHHIKHLAQVIYTAGTARTAPETYHAFYGGDMAKAP